MNTLLKTLPFQQLACPLDDLPLSRHDSAWVCDNGHSFDIASKGYTHLLPVQHKRSKNPGDSKAMVAARQRFLHAGFYQRIADAINRAVLAGEEPAALNCLDAGCGEGYYLRELSAARSARALSLLGVDISKWAILAAARQDKRPCWVVGTNAHLPAATNSIDRVLCLFGFPVYPEFVRVLKPAGLLIQADPGAGHLRELRDIIYPDERPKQHYTKPAPEPFVFQAVENVNFSMTLRGKETIDDLMVMTPHFYRASATGRAALAELDSLTVTVDVNITTLVYDASKKKETLTNDA